MRVSERAISAIAEIIAGNQIKTTEGMVTLAPYRSGSKLVKFFNEHGFNDHYGSDFGSRTPYAEACIRAKNGTPALKQIIESALEPSNFR